MTDAEGQAWRAAAQANAERLAAMTLDLQLLAHQFQAQIETLQLFAGGILEAAGWVDGALVDVEAESIVALACKTGLIYPAGPAGAFFPTPVGSRAIGASISRTRSGLN